MEITPPPFYLNWVFWSFVVAFIALLFSQIPPIRTLLKKANLELELYSKISLSHKVGNPNIALHLIINNTGGTKIRIKGIVANILQNQKEKCCLPGQNFYPNQQDKDSVLLTTFSLKPDEEWSHFVNFFRFFEREEEKKYREMEGKLKSDILDNRKTSNFNPEALVEATSVLVDPFHDFFNDRFVYIAGEYELKVQIITDSESANIEKSYRFTIFEYYEEELRKQTEEYKYGLGICWHSSTPNNILLDIKEL